MKKQSTEEVYCTQIREPEAPSWVQAWGGELLGLSLKNLQKLGSIAKREE